MPITEVPNQEAPPDEPQPPQPPRTGSRRYEDLDAEDLLHAIDELEDRHSWARVREMIWLSIIIHMAVLWYLIYGPRYFFHVRVIDPSVVMRQREKEMTYLDLPKDALKQARPKIPKAISDQNRIAQTKAPTLDRKTLQELEAMRRAGPPKESQAPPAPVQPQVAQAPAPPKPAPPAPPAQPLPNNNVSKLEAPRQAPTQPNFHTGPTSPNDQLRQALQAASRDGATQSGGDMGENAPPQHGGMAGAVDILSDTMGVDFGHYIQQVIAATKRAWYPIIPEEARPPLDKQGKVMIRFKIAPDGSVNSMVLEGPSGDVALDKAAWGGITGATPYPPLPRDFKGPYLELRFYFLYNVRPGEE